jgi:hypothetical protein
MQGLEEKQLLVRTEMQFLARRKPSLCRTSRRSVTTTTTAVKPEWQHPGPIGMTVRPLIDDKICTRIKKKRNKKKNQKMHETEFTNEHSTIVKVENEANAKLMDLRAPHVQCAKENENKKSSEVELNIGTDCSGLEAPLFALRNIGVNHRLKFSCDNDPEVRKNHEANFMPEVFYPDINTRQTSDMPTVDIYVAGFPCQPFSEAGKK